MQSHEEAQIRKKRLSIMLLHSSAVFVTSEIAWRQRMTATMKKMSVVQYDSGVPPSAFKPFGAPSMPSRPATNRSLDSYYITSTQIRPRKSRENLLKWTIAY